MNCLIVDDHQISRVVLRGMVELDPSLILIKECSDAMDAHKEIMNNQIDLLLLDIEMPGMSGMELAESLKSKRPVIIFITSLPGYAVDAFNLNVVDFLVKPVTASRFLKAIEKAKELIKLRGFVEDTQNDEFVFIRDSNILKRLDMADILYMEAKGDYVKLNLKGQTHSIHSSLKSIEQKLPKDIFFRVHRSFIVNLSKIDSVEGGTLIVNHQMVPVSDLYRAALYKRLQIL
ncbi:LytR/AlgR family response regulator transcription factor [Mucilaginibacter lappiensis]|uniref:DNA-binding LytR/AlgR family response regulator n=1 Tax=Mucilaginibacter lappiensis TaxID=354630 RepID=A0A841JII1_9SPHI|nr:LytTR family DNA-binding domain-containing protein [Mucilaginibacter lappiensis]MBB6130750.1 DNA-binding LytR/AlgR family response regulator [Mucilaginibacter lappiensis]